MGDPKHSAGRFLRQAESGLPPEIVAEMRVQERRMGPAEALNLGEPSIPRPAASVILLRRGGRHANRGLEVLLARRSDNSTFMPGVWVFPGGSVDPEDGPTHPEGAAQRACAARELKEEVGIALPPEAELVPYARWITPTVVKTRFDAWFFLALAPPHSPLAPTGSRPTTPAGSPRPRPLPLSKPATCPWSFPPSISYAALPSLNPPPKLWPPGAGAGSHR